MRAPHATGLESGAPVPPLPVSLYVHVPFCISKCAYCDFYSVAGHSERFGQYVDAALFEAGHWSHYDLLDDVPTMYLGGGTPTLLGDQVVRLVAGMRETARLRPDAEITVETNPETTSEALLARLLTAGVNRFSLGVQSFDDAVLRTLGRCHDAARANAAAGTLASSGAVFSLDLICGVPGQGLDSWTESLDRAIATGAQHVSVYPLTIEEGTPLAASVGSGEVSPPDPDAAADMMLLARDRLAAAGLQRYEIANYARPGFESRHNSVYWQGGAYIGVGPGAASMLPIGPFETVARGEAWSLGADTRDAVRVRFTRHSDLHTYARHPLASPAPFEFLDATEAQREDVMLGMRRSVGVAKGAVADAGLSAVMEALANDGLVRHQEEGDGSPGRWALTDRGWLLGNRVFGALWEGRPPSDRTV